MEDKSSIIFGNKISSSVLRKAEKNQRKFLKKFGDDRNENYHLVAVDNDVLTSIMNVKVLKLQKDDKCKEPLSLPPKSIIIGNIRMGFGHYRISMAIASAANKLGYTPYWLDLNSFPETTCTKIISYQNNLYSFGSRLSQKSKLFNKFVWEPMNCEGFKKLSYNAGDQKMSELMVPVLNDLQKDIPFIATHVWPSQAAVHAGLTNVVNAIPDNWPMALHLSEGAVHTVQTPSSYLGYRTLKGFDGKKILNPMKKEDIFYAGHYVDDELVCNIEKDCEMRLDRVKNDKPIRFLLSIGGAGAQGEYFIGLIKTLLPLIKMNKAVLYLNIGDYQKVWDYFVENIPEISAIATTHFNNWNETKNFAENAIEEKSIDSVYSKNVHVFCNKDIFAAVYTTNLLMRACDVLITKPSELSFYPIPKLMIQHVGGHEKWGAIRSAEIGDGTPECFDLEYAEFMISQMVENRDIIENMCNAILCAKKEGIYNGAYHSVELATKIVNSEYKYAGK